jgi:hypothetical protein
MERRALEVEDVGQTLEGVGHLLPLPLGAQVLPVVERFEQGRQGERGASGHRSHSLPGCPGFGAIYPDRPGQTARVGEGLQLA